MPWPLHPVFVRNVIYPIYRGLRGDRILNVLEDLEKNQWLSPEELDEVRWRRLEEYLRQITTHVPYYRDLFRNAGLSAQDIQNPSDLLRIPALTKELIRGESSRLVTRDPMRRGYPSSTGGSTGEPLYFYCDHAASPIRRANTLRATRWTRADIGDKQAMFWGLRMDRSFRERFADEVKNYFNNIVYFSTFDMSDASMGRYAARLRRYRPQLVTGYPSALTIFAEFCKRRQLKPPRPIAVITSGERLYPHQRGIIEELFSSSVFDRYGSREFSNVAHECDEHRGLHLFSDLFYTEVIHESGRPAEDGEIGELVVTDLSNLYMPFLRYRTGDLAVPAGQRCPCGRGFPLLERIEGRTFDAVVTPEGKSIGGFFWTWLSRFVPGIGRFQIEQRERGGIIFRIVPGHGWRDDSKQALEAKIKENCGEHFRVKFVIDDDIPLTPAGKSKFIVSKIEERYVVKSKIHKARITGEDTGCFDCLIIDEDLMELSDIAPGEKVLIVDNTNGARIETFAVRGKRGGGKIVSGGGVASCIRTGDEVSIMAFTWADDIRGKFKNILVGDDNRFLRYLTESAGERL